ncbi:hypothetical protein [Candidatus Pyrohabitans sp.]
MAACIYCGEVAEFLVYRARGGYAYQGGVFLCEEHITRVVERNAQHKHVHH